MLSENLKRDNNKIRMLICLNQTPEKQYVYFSTYLNKFKTFGQEINFSVNLNSGRVCH